MTQLLAAHAKVTALHNCKKVISRSRRKATTCPGRVNLVVLFGSLASVVHPDGSIYCEAARKCSKNKKYFST